MQRLAGLILLAGWAGLAQPPGRGSSLAFTHVTVIDTVSGAARADMTVVVGGDRIRATGKTRAVRPPPDARVVDASGKFVIPGLWDMHVHMFRGAAPIRNPPEASPSWFLTLLVANGVTGARDMGGYLDTVLDWRRRVNAGLVLGPRLVVAGAPVDGPRPMFPYCLAAPSASDARDAVRALKGRGVDFVKVLELVSPDVYDALADEAKRQRLPFVGHVPQMVGARHASDTGQRTIEHLTGVLRACSRDETQLQREATEILQRPEGTGLELREHIRRGEAQRLLGTHDEAKCRRLFARFAKNGTWQVPTLTGGRGAALMRDARFTNDGRLKYVLATVRAAWNPESDTRHKGLSVEEVAARQAIYDKHVELVGKMHRGGVRFLAGSDTPNPFVFPGFSLHDELALFVAAGFSPLQALQTATLDPAIFLGRLPDLGTVEPGKLADLVLLDANPLIDIRNTTRIDAVVLDGRLLDRAELDRMLADVETTARPAAP